VLLNVDIFVAMMLVISGSIAKEEWDTNFNWQDIGYTISGCIPVFLIKIIEQLPWLQINWTP